MSQSTSLRRQDRDDIEEIMTPNEAERLKLSRYPSVARQETGSDEYTWERGGEKNNLIFIREGRMTFAAIDAAHISYEETERRANLFCAAPSMLSLLEVALPIIEEEAERRRSWGERHNSQGHQYATEMRELANEISAEIDRAYGREAKRQSRTEEQRE